MVSTKTGRTSLQDHDHAVDGTWNRCLKILASSHGEVFIATDLFAVLVEIGLPTVVTAARSIRIRAIALMGAYHR